MKKGELWDIFTYIEGISLLDHSEKRKRDFMTVLDSIIFLKSVIWGKGRITSLQICFVKDKTFFRPYNHGDKNLLWI